MLPSIRFRGFFLEGKKVGGGVCPQNAGVGGDLTSSKCGLLVK